MANKKFLWGAAISANQSEGGYNEGGKGLSLVDVLSLSNNRVERMKNVEKNHIDANDFFPSHTSIDFYHYFKEDIRTLKELGINCFRFSISWPRIYPTGLEDKPNQEGLSFYEKILDELEKYGIEPLVTINHFDTPYFLAKEYNGWLDKRTVEAYTKYCKTLFQHFDGRINYWITHNEINMIQHMPYLGGGLYEKKYQDSIQARFQAAHHLLLGSAYAVQEAKKINENNQIGCMTAAGITYGNTCHPKDVFKAWEKNQESYILTDVQIFGEYSGYFNHYLKRNGIKIEISDHEREVLKSNTCDYVAFSYYSSRLTSADPKMQNKTSGNVFSTLRNHYLSRTDWGWQIDPIGMKTTMVNLYDHYKKPLFCVENGIGCRDEYKNGEVDDQKRITFLNDHIQSLEEAIDLGVDCIGYAIWSAIDLVSASSGELNKRYGLLYVDVDDQGNGSLKRYKKKSFYWYKKKIEKSHL